MNDNTKPSPKCSSPVSKAEVQCDECGTFGAYEIAGRHLCPDCYSEKGSCCPEFGKDDLWRFEEPRSKRQD